jgi:hypothetical protein
MWVPSTRAMEPDWVAQSLQFVFTMTSTAVSTRRPRRQGREQDPSRRSSFPRRRAPTIRHPQPRSATRNAECPSRMRPEAHSQHISSRRGEPIEEPRRAGLCTHTLHHTGFGRSGSGGLEAPDLNSLDRSRARVCTKLLTLGRSMNAAKIGPWRSFNLDKSYDNGRFALRRPAVQTAVSWRPNADRHSIRNLFSPRLATAGVLTGIARTRSSFRRETLRLRSSTSREAR